LEAAVVAASIFPSEASQIATSLSMDYPQFTRVIVPEGSNAESAWIGEIQPFASDNVAKAFLHNIENNGPIWVSSGRIREERLGKPHWADPLLVGMSVRCKLLILMQPAPAHPRAYLLSPAFPEHYSVVHPHPRFDQMIVRNHKKVPGLCIYSAPEFRYDQTRERNSQFLEQATLFVARHLIWLKTRQLFRGFPHTGTLLKVLRPGEILLEDKPVLRQPANGTGKPILDYWAGYWPGPTAHAFDAATHLKTIRPHHECWCGSGVAYGTCHRPADLISVGAQYEGKV
jgi:hypothetical protein